METVENAERAETEVRAEAIWREREERREQRERRQNRGSKVSGDRTKGAERAERDQGTDKRTGRVERGNCVGREGDIVVMRSQMARSWYRRKKNKK